MQVSYDKKTDTKYIRVKAGKIAYTSEERDWLFFDRDKNDEVLGVEVLDASKHPLTVSALTGVGLYSVFEHGNKEWRNAVAEAPVENYVFGQPQVSFS